MVNDVPGAPTEGLHVARRGSRKVIFSPRGSTSAAAKGTKLYGARSTDGGVTWSKNVLIYESPEGTICECCHPSVAIDPGGQILVMWRNWLAGARDMYLARSRDGVTFSKPEKLGTGTWQLNACPMDGGGLAVAQNRVVTAWRREHEIFLASPGEREVAIGEGVDVAIAGGAEVFTQSGRHRRRSMLLPGKEQSITVAPKGTFPSVCVLSNGHALAAWEDDGKVQVQQIP